MGINKIVRHLKWQINYNLKIILPQKVLATFLPKRVLSGPFEGMKYLSNSTGSVILPKLIGTYEDELHDILTKITNGNYFRFIDIGAAEGYYAVGISKFLLPKVKDVIAFEATSEGRNLIKKLAKLNDVNNININGFCDIETLSKALGFEKTFMIVDIEGGEYTLLDPTKINFDKCDILIEIHYMNGINKLDELEYRFRNTHKCIIIEKGTKYIPTDVKVSSVIKKYAKTVVNEYRGDQKWLFLTSKIL